MTVSRDMSRTLVSIAASAVTAMAVLHYRWVQRHERKKRLLRHVSLSTLGSIYSSGFLQVIQPLYDLQMGCENIGPMLYSLLRFLKPCRVLEVGAGYTSIYLLQALKDNVEELEAIQESREQANTSTGSTSTHSHDTLLQDMFLEVPFPETTLNPELHIMDNMEHEATTAHLVEETANTLGTDSYLHVIVADCFEYELKDQYDFIWLDGITTDPQFPQLFEKYWRHSLRDGGYMAVHSTLTNTIARKWLSNLVNDSKRRVSMVGVRFELKLFVDSNIDWKILADSIQNDIWNSNDNNNSNSESNKSELEWIDMPRVEPIGYGIQKMILSCLVRDLDFAHQIAERLESDYVDHFQSVDTVPDPFLVNLVPSSSCLLSFLEPHKRFQNSCSIFQKQTVNYAEPIYSWSP